MLTLCGVSSSKVLPLGSDFPIEGINPLLGFYAAVSRLSIDGGSPHGAAGWYAKTCYHFNFYLTSESQVSKTAPDSCASAERHDSGCGLCLVCRNRTWITNAWQERWAGPIRTYNVLMVYLFSADFVILDSDIMTIPFFEILSTKVQATVIDGAVAYGSL